MYTQNHFNFILKITLLVILIRILNNVSFEKKKFLLESVIRNENEVIDLLLFIRWSFPHWTSCFTLKLCCLPSTT